MICPTIIGGNPTINGAIYVFHLGLSTEGQREEVRRLLGEILDREK